jgi:hypothetical protein
MPPNVPLLDATRRAADMLGLPPLLLKAFMGVEGANVNHPDGVLQVTASTRAAVIKRISRAIKLAALGLNDDPAIDDDDPSPVGTSLNNRFAQAFAAKNLLVQVLTGGQYIREQLDRFNGYVALAGLAYNAGPGRAAKAVEQFGSDPFRAALQYHKRIGPGVNDVTVQPGIPSIDAATGAKWIRYPVTANDSGIELFQYLYLRQVPKRNFGLLDFIFRPSLLESRGLFENDAPPADDVSHLALAVAGGKFRQVGGQSSMFNTQPLSQRDPRWKDLLLGFTNEGLTIGSDGCTLTCATMMANGFGFQETPATLNDKLKALGQNQGFFGALLGWYGVPRALQGLKINALVECADKPAPMADIDAALDAGRPVIVELDQSPNALFQNHWVLIYARQGGDYLIRDPWPVPAEASASLIQRYGFAGAPAKIITYAVFYDNPSFTPGDGDHKPPDEAALVIVVNNDADIISLGGLALREGPNGSSAIKMRLPAGTTLTSLEAPAQVRSKVGVFGQWLNVKTQAGVEGFVGAWKVHVREARDAVISKDLAEAIRSSLQAELGVQPPLRPKTLVVVKRNTMLRVKPKDGKVVATIKAKATLEVIESARSAEGKIGKRDKWIKVLARNGAVGYIAASAVAIKPSPKPKKQATRERGLGVELLAAGTMPEPDARPIVRVIAQPGLNLREAPSLTARVKRVLPFGEVLEIGEPLATALPKIGVEGQWLRVVTSEGVAGFVAAQYVQLVSEPGDLTDIIAQGTALAFADAPLLRSNTASSGSDWMVTAGTPLRVMNGADWSKIGNPNEFVRVESFAFKQGFVRGSLLRAPDFADRRVKVEDGPLPFGISAWLYGLHDPYDRGLFDGSGRRGWVLFTERVVSGAGNQAYSDWARNGYGVIARLNNDYGGSGTVPVPSEYDRFAAQCAQWVHNSPLPQPGRVIWLIGNEMNNPREWPGEGSDPSKAITPESYAACFNKVRAAIKAVQPNAIVVPGAVDPFQGPSISCLDWFRRMLANIQDLDGLGLHCYTHGYTPNLVPSLATFQDPPLQQQYYHLRAYSTFLDLIPPRHRRKPVYITETDPFGSEPWSGGQNGWVQAAYREIDRYNDQPHAQQIQTLILYRWSRDDVFSIVDKPAVQNDIRATVNSTDYRWRA